MIHDYMIEAGVFLNILYLALIFYLINLKNKYFLATDRIPDVLPQSNLELDDPSKLLKINAGIYIRDFPMFDMVRNHFIMNALVWFEFDFGKINISALDEFTFENASKILRFGKTITKNGNMMMVQYSVQVQFSSNLDYQYFPVEDHRFFITLTNNYFSPREVEFIVEPINVNFPKGIDMHDWKISGKETNAGYTDILFDESTGKKIQRPRIIFTLKLKKAGLRKSFLIIGPILLILIVSSTTLLFSESSKLHTMLPTAIGCLTGILAYRFVINSMSPNVTYLMFFEYIYNVALILIFINFLLVSTNSLVNVKLFHDVSVGLSVYLMTKLLLIGVVVYYLYYKKNRQDTQAVLIKKQLNNVKLQHLLKKFNIKTLMQFKKSMTENNHKWYFPLLNSILTPRYNQLFSPKKLWTVFSAFESFCVKRNSVIKSSLGKSSQVIVFNSATNLFVLIQHLDKLVHLNVMSDNLQLVNPHDRIIFNGNITGDEKHFLKTIALVFILMIKNPGKVFVLEGYQERYQIWKNNAEDTFLKIFGKKDKQAIAYLAGLLNQLPLAMYLCHQGQFIRISCFDNESRQHINKAFSDFLLNKQEKDTYVLPSNQLPAESDLKVSFLATLSNVKSEIPQTCLEMKMPTYKAIAWTLPDADSGKFVILSLFADNNERQISSLQSLNSSDRVYEEMSYDLIYGFHLSKKKKSEPFVLKENFILGSTMDMSRTSSIVSTRIRYGLYTKLIDQNLNGIHDQRVQLKILDDEYTPSLAKRNAHRLLEILPPKIILSPLGTPTLESYFPMIQQEKLLVLFPISGGSFFRVPECSHVIAIRASFAEEGCVLLKYAIEIKGMSRIAVYYQNDSYGLGALHGVEPLLKNYQIDWLPVPYQRNTIDTAQSAQKIIDFNADTIIFFSTAAPAISLIHELGIQRVGDITLLAISYASNSFQEYLQSIGVPLIRTHVSPALDSDLEIVKEYHEARKQSLVRFPASDESLEGYINASILCETLKAIEPPFTKEKIIEYLTNLKNVPYKGLMLNFNPEKREILHEIWIEARNG